MGAATTSMHTRWLLLLTLVMLGACAARAARGSMPQLIGSVAGHARSKSTLVLYLYASVDQESKANLRYFVLGVARDPTADYLVILHASAHQVRLAGR